MSPYVPFSFLLMFSSADYPASLIPSLSFWDIKKGQKILNFTDGSTFLQFNLQQSYFFHLEIWRQFVSHRVKIFNKKAWIWVLCRGIKWRIVFIVKGQRNWFLFSSHICLSRYTQFIHCLFYQFIYWLILKQKIYMTLIKII